MELDLLVDRVKREGVSLGTINGKLLVVDPTRRLSDDLYDQLDEHNSELVQFFMRKARKQDAYWKRSIAEQFSATTLIDSAAFAQPEQSGNGSARLVLNPQVRSDIGAAAASSETLFGLAWACLLARYSGERHASYLAATSSRSVGLNGIADLKGLIVNLHPVDVALPKDADLALLLQHSQARRVQQGEYGFPAFSEGNQFSGKAYVADSVLVFDDVGVPLATPGRELCSLVNLGQLPLKVLAIVTDDHAAASLTIEIQYKREHLSDANAEALAGALGALAGQLAAVAAGRAIAALEMVTGAEREQLLELGTGAQGGAPGVARIDQLVEQAAALYPQRTAIVWRGKTLSYAELNRKANQLARHLIGTDVAAGQVIGICMARTPELLIAMLAVLKAGCAYLPLDPNYPESRLDFMLKDSGAGMVIANRSYAARIALSGAGGQVVLYDTDEASFDALDATNPAVSVAGPALAYVIYTSGSTGFPKGVMIEHGATVSFLHWARSQFSLEELRSVLCSTSICFDLSIFEIFLPLASGTQVVLVDSILELFDASPATDISLINSVPSAMAELIENSRIPASVMTVCLAGEPLRRKLVSRIYAHATVNAVYNLYGPSEYTTYATFARLARDESGEPRIGRPLHDTRVAVLDADGALVPVGVKGELFIGGANISRGYINRPELTAEKFLADPFTPGATIYRTGDFVRWTQQGELEFVGRCDEQVKLRGFRVELGEIEAQLIALEAIDNAAVLVREDQDGEKRLVAYIALAQTGAHNEDRSAIRETIKHSLAVVLPAHMVPEVYLFLPELPLTLNGKIDRKRLPQPEQGDLQAKQYVAPRDDIERVLCGHFEKLLGVARVGIDDDFFGMGGHSLLVFRLLILIRTSFSVDIALKSIFESPTVNQLGELVRQSQAGAALPLIARCDRGGELAASFAQQRFWFLYKLDETSAEYNLPLLFKLKGELDLTAFRNALDKMVERHEVLRTVLKERDGVLYQQIIEGCTAPLGIIKLTHLAPAAAALAARAHFDQDLNTAFRLDAEIPVRFVLARVADDEHHVLFNVHHVATDGWSMNVMRREFAELYGAYAHAAPSKLPALPVQYADFAAWQRNCLNDNTLTGLRSYWKETLKDSPRLHELPLDHARPAQQGVVGRGVQTRVDAVLLAQFKALCASQGATLFMGLQTVYAALLGRWSERNDIMMGTPVAGRTVAEVEPLVGFFMNNVTLRSRLDAAASFTGLLGQAKRMILGALEGQQFPFDALVSELELRRQPSHQPIFQVWFVLQSQNNVYPEVQGLQMGPLDARALTARIVHFDLSLNASESADQLDLLWEFQHELFEPSTIEALAAGFSTLLEHAVRAPDAAFMALPLCAPSRPDPQALAQSAPQAVTDLLAQLATSAASDPAATALIQGERHIGYAELGARSASVAGYLAAQGVQRGQLVLVRMAHGIDTIVTLLGIMRCGAAYAIVPPSIETAQLEQLCASGQACGIIGDTALPGVWPVDEALAWSGTAPMSQADGALRFAWIERGPDGAMHIEHAPQEPALLLTHLQAQAERCALNQDSILLLLPQSLHFAPYEWVLGLLLGATLQLADDCVDQNDPTHMTLTPGLLAALDPADYPGVSSILLTGEACPSWNAWRWSASCQVLNAFSCKQLPFITAEHIVRDQQITLGQAILPARTLLLDRNGSNVPDAMAAELHLVGAASRWHGTGAQLRRRPDGKYLLAGQRNMARVHGYDLDLDAIEARIAAQDDVLGVMLQTAGSGEATRLVALIASDVGVHRRQEFTAVLKQTLSRVLPLYQQPEVLIVLDALPVNEEGKLDRTVLANCHHLRALRTAELAALALPENNAANADGQLASLKGARSELTFRLSATEARARVGCTDEVFLLSAFSILMALDSGQDALGIAYSCMADRAPLVHGTASAAVHAASFVAAVPDDTALRDVAAALAVSLAATRRQPLLSYLSLIEGEVAQGRSCQGARYQLVFSPAGQSLQGVASCAPLRLDLTRSGDVLSLAWHYCADSYTEEKVLALSRRLQRLVALLLGDPDAWVKTLRHRLDLDVKSTIMDLKNRFK